MTSVHHPQHLCFEKHAHFVFGQHVAVVFVILYLNVTFYIIKFGGKSSLLHWIHIRGLFLWLG